jgi:hypothetical protein
LLSDHEAEECKTADGSDSSLSGQPSTVSGLTVGHPGGASILNVFSVGIYILQQLSLHHLLVVRRAAATWKEASVPSFHNDPTLVYCFSMRRMHVRYLEGEKRKKRKASKLVAAMPKRR